MHTVLLLTLAVLNVVPNLALQIRLINLVLQLAAQLIQEYARIVPHVKMTLPLQATLDVVQYAVVILVDQLLYVLQMIAVTTPVW